jgi:hypothetical protein
VLLVIVDTGNAKWEGLKELEPFILVDFREGEWLNMVGYVEGE